jgi:DNA invertase Pin-like site-specific DNA recombinase
VKVPYVGHCLRERLADRLRARLDRCAGPDRAADALEALGVAPSRTYVDHGLTGTRRDRPGLREAMAACRAGDTLVVTKLDRLARSLPDARDIVEELTKREVSLSIGGAVHDPSDPVGRLLFNVLAMVAEFEADLIRMRTREGMKVARAKGRLRGKQPKLSSQPATGKPRRRGLRSGGARRPAAADRLLGAVGGCEPDLALVELAAQLGEAVLGELAGGELEGAGEQLESMAAAGRRLVSRCRSGAGKASVTPAWASSAQAGCAICATERSTYRRAR